MVALLPGMMMRSASLGIGVPGLQKTTSIFSSFFKGSISSKFAMRGSIGTATRNFSFFEYADFSSTTASSGGKSPTHLRNGTTPKFGHPVSSSMRTSPPSKRLTSPRNRLIIVPLIRACSSGGSSLCVPVTAAITPPRLISPISTTGVLVGSAKPMLAISFARRFTSAGLPAPSIRTRSASRLSLVKLSITAPSKCFFMVW